MQGQSETLLASRDSRKVNRILFKVGMEMKEVEPGNFALTQLRKIREEVGSDDGIVLVHLLIKLHECLKYLRLSPCVNNSPYFKIIYEALISNRSSRDGTVQNWDESSGQEISFDAVFAQEFESFRAWSVWR